MIYIEKDKNMLYFHCEERKTPASLDINTGKFLSYNGKEVTTIPPYINAMLINYGRDENHTNLGAVLSIIAERHAILSADEYAYRMKIADRLDSAGVKNYYPPYSICESTYYEIEKHFKEFLKFASKNEGVDFTFSDFERAMHEQALAKKLGVEELPQNFAANMRQYDIDMKYARNALNWYNKIYPFFKAMHPESIYNAKYTFWDTLKKYYDYCEKVNEEPQKSNNFMSEFARVAETYQLNKEAIDNNCLKRMQLKKENALRFEDDNFFVSIPVTRDEFRDESNQQNNCVYRSYLSKVMTGRTSIVFIRKKDDPTHSYITCEVCNGNIVQYLGKNNVPRVGKLAEEFRQNYQAHLSENWNLSE